MERKIRSLIRWNALVMVLRANKSSDDLGGHIATFSPQQRCMTLDLIIFSKGQKMVKKI